MITSNNAHENWIDFRQEFKGCFKKDFDVAIEQLFNTSDTWKPFPGWEDLDDIQIFNEVTKGNKVFGNVFAITEVSYRPDVGPFFLDSMDLENLVLHHLSNYKECFFNGDTFIINIDKKEIWFFHHEGIYVYKNFSDSKTLN